MEDKISSEIFMAQTQLFKVRVSALSHWCVCPKRCKLEVYHMVEKSEGDNKAMVTGTKMHFEYSVPYKSFDRRILRYQLEQKCGKVFSKQIDNVVVRGSYDDLRVLFNPRTKEKFVSILEIKTTNKQRMWNVEVASATFQLSLYIWLLKEHIEALGWKLHKRHYVEVYSQKTKRLLKRIVVTEDLNMDNRIRYILRAFQGLEPWRYPENYVCRLCPRNVKEKCWLYQERRKR